MRKIINQTLKRAIAAHREGQLQNAERLYREILTIQPKHSDANHNLGLIAMSLHKAALALPLLKSAIEANPKVDQYWLSYIKALINEKLFDDAKQKLVEAERQGVDKNKLKSLEANLTNNAPGLETQRTSPKSILKYAEEQKKNLEVVRAIRRMNKNYRLKLHHNKNSATF